MDFLRPNRLQHVRGVYGPLHVDSHGSFLPDLHRDGFPRYWHAGADDTASVYLDTGVVTSGTGSSGTLKWAANPNLGNNCANQPIGCTTGMDAAIQLSLSAGTYTIVIDAYQIVGGSPFGVMYDGVLNADGSTPEPATFMPMGLGVAALGTLIRRRK